MRRVMDEDIQSKVLELTGANVSTSYISCPADPSKALGIKHPFLVLVVKNLHQYFTFEVQVLDDKNVKRRFRASNYQVGESDEKQAEPPCVPVWMWPGINGIQR